MSVHVVHSRGGKIGEGTDTSAADIDALVDALKQDRRAHLAIHFHGGLVPKATGMEIATRLSDRYGAHAMPVFYVWETGFFETLKNNLRELPKEPVFKQLVRKVLQYAVERLGGTVGGRSVVPGGEEQNVREAIERHWTEGTQESVPYRSFVPDPGGVKARSAMDAIDLDELRGDLETDSEFAFAMATLPDLKPSTRSALAPAGATERRSPFSEALADRFSEQPGTRGIVSWIKVALLVKDVLVGVLRRYASKRDHGLYATVVEEVLRETKLGGSDVNEWGKALQWNRMKQDTLDAFGDHGDEHAGTALLSRLVPVLTADGGPKRITLIGHSTGAIYIAHWLAAADKLLPKGIRFDIVLLAPAITYQAFDKVLSAYKDRIGHFRMFAMRDNHERDDQVWGDDTDLQDGRDWRSIVYPSSLLYLVSGILESRVLADGSLEDEADMPLLGLERHYALKDIYIGEGFRDVERVRAWLDESPGRLVWAKAEGQPDGLNCVSIDHGAFDNDEQTLLSIGAVLRGW